MSNQLDPTKSDTMPELTEDLHCQEDNIFYDQEDKGKCQSPKMNLDESPPEHEFNLNSESKMSANLQTPEFYAARDGFQNQLAGPAFTNNLESEGFYTQDEIAKSFRNFMRGGITSELPDC